MRYRNFEGLNIEVSALGFGCMRFQTIQDGSNEKIDRPLAIDMLRRAIDNGVNYVDTAFYYHDGESEPLLGEALLDGYRDKVYLATKCPIYDVKAPGDFEKFLDIQLERLKTDHIDFYLLHTLNSELWHEHTLKYDVLNSMKKAKDAGKIRYCGFSFHDSLPVFKEIVDSFDWDFCQIQYNYVDTDVQAGTEGLEYAGAKGLGVIIMEPLRGGRLASPPELVARQLPEGKSAVEAALDFLWDKPEVALLLSGMSTPEQVEDNLKYADRSSVGMLTEAERSCFVAAKEIYNTVPLVSCTGCRYCMPCPNGVDIPGAFAAYNKSVSKGKKNASKIYAELNGKAELCIECASCESACPQKLAIIKELKAVKEYFEDD